MTQKNAFARPAPAAKDAALIAQMIRFGLLLVDSLVLLDAPITLRAPLDTALQQLQAESCGAVLAQQLTAIAEHLAQAEAWLLAVRL